MWYSFYYNINYIPIPSIGQYIVKYNATKNVKINYLNSDIISVKYAKPISYKIELVKSDLLDIKYVKKSIKIIYNE